MVTLNHRLLSLLPILLTLFSIPSVVILSFQVSRYQFRDKKVSSISEILFRIQPSNSKGLSKPLNMCLVYDKFLRNSTETRNQTSATYSKKDVMLNVAKQNPSAAYRVQLPKGMSFPTLTAKEQIIADRVKESLKEDSSKTDLDLLKEELRKIIEKLG